MIAWCILCLKALHLCDCCDVAARTALASLTGEGL